jgi:hypothetical protein
MQNRSGSAEPDADAAGQDQATVSAEVAAGCKAAAAAQSPPREPASDSDSDVVIVNDEDNEADDGGGDGFGLASSCGGYSGFYRAVREGGRANVLLALRAAGSQPPRFRLVRPATGKGAKTIDLQELRNKCAALFAEHCLGISCFPAFSNESPMHLQSRELYSAEVLRALTPQMWTTHMLTPFCHEHGCSVLEMVPVRAQTRSLFSLRSATSD